MFAEVGLCDAQMLPIMRPIASGQTLVDVDRGDGRPQKGHSCQPAAWRDGARRYQRRQGCGHGKLAFAVFSSLSGTMQQLQKCSVGSRFSSVPRPCHRISATSCLEVVPMHCQACNLGTCLAAVVLPVQMATRATPARTRGFSSCSKEQDAAVGFLARCCMLWKIEFSTKASTACRHMLASIKCHERCAVALQHIACMIVHVI